MESIYRRPLPESQIAFSSHEGRVLFREALAAGTMESYFALAEQHHTQAEPAFCGLASLVVALNALAIDPGRLWKGPWRWFSEELLDCCVPLSLVQSSGLTLDELACLARCNGATAHVQRAMPGATADLRRALDASSRSPTGPVLIAAYARSHLGQTGAGHFSPLAGYHAGRDLALLLDVARFKYPPHWVSVEQLFQAMQAIDPTTEKSRGFIELERAVAPSNLALVFTNQRGGCQAIIRFIRQEARELLHARAPADTRAALRVLADGTHALANCVALRSGSDRRHEQVVETVLCQLRATELHARIRELATAAVSELTCVLVLLLPRETYRSLDPAVSAELEALADVDRLQEPLRSDLNVLRAQLHELSRCGDAACLSA